MRKFTSILILAFLSIQPLSAHDAGKTEGAIVVKKLASSTKSWNGTEMPAYPKGQPKVTILRITIQPGVKLPLHYHPVINAGVLLKGELTVVSKKGETLHMKAGDPIIELVDQWHYGKNEGTEPAEIIVFYAGTKGDPITEKE